MLCNVQRNPMPNDPNPHFASGWLVGTHTIICAAHNLFNVDTNAQSGIALNTRSLGAISCGRPLSFT
jgi:hypothetical protein